MTPGELAAQAQLDVWQRIFGDAMGYLGLLALTANEKPHVAFVRYPDDAARALDWLAAEDRRGWNTYACAHLLTGRKRDADHAAPVTALWADLDGAPLPAGELAPSVVLETSPGRYHCWWKLSEAIEPERAERLNQRLAEAIGADPSGADLSQVLRVAGTHNHKYDPAPEVRLWS